MLRICKYRCGHSALWKTTPLLPGHLRVRSTSSTQPEVSQDVPLQKSCRRPLPFLETMADLLLGVKSPTNLTGFQRFPFQPTAHSLLMHSLHLPRCHLLLVYALDFTLPPLCQSPAFTSMIWTFCHVVQLHIKPFYSRSYAKMIFVVPLLEKSYARL